MIVNHVRIRGKLALSALVLAATIYQPVMAEARENLEWIKVLGPSMSSAASMEKTADGGLIMTGEVREASGQTGLLLVKTDADGKQQWSRTVHYNGDGRSSGKKVRQTVDGGYIVVGTTFNMDKGRPNDDMLLVKTDAQGATQWEKRFGGGQAERGEDAVELPDGGYLIAGTLIIGSVPTRIGIITRTDREGHELWTRMFGDNNRSTGIGLHTLLPLKDGTFLAGGQHASTFLSSDGKAYVIRVNDQGELLSEWDFDGGSSGGQAELFDLQPAADGGFIAAGYVNDGRGNGADLYLLKLDKDGKKQWETILGGTGFDFGNAVRPTEDGGYIVSGTLAAQAGGSTDLWIVKTDGSGKLQWQQTAGGAGNEQGNGIVQTGKGVYLAAGDTTLAEAIPPAGGGASAAQGSRMLLAKMKESEVPDEPKEELVGIEFKSSSYDLLLGESAPTVLEAVYRNGTRRPLSGAATYYSNDSGIARIDRQGVLTGLAQGTTFLTAVYEGLTTNATVTVRDPKAPELIGLTAKPERLELAAGSVGNVALQALYSDGSVKDVTAQARWYINNPKLAVHEKGGIIRGAAPGSTFVTAEYAGQTVVIDVIVK